MQSNQNKVGRILTDECGSNSFRYQTSAMPFHKNTFYCNEKFQSTHGQSPSSEEDSSANELNNCRRLIDKPPLVKRLAMSLLKTSEDSKPLVLKKSPDFNSSHKILDCYVNENIYDQNRNFSNNLNRSCQKTLRFSPENRLNDVNKCDSKKQLAREYNVSTNVRSLHKCMEGLSLAEYNELIDAAWFQAGIPRDISLEVLDRQSPGAFLVRKSTTKHDCFALSLRVPPPAPKVAHYLILKTQKGYKIKGFTKEFSSLKALITHHSVMPELLPVTLSLPRPQSANAHAKHLDDFETYDFRRNSSESSNVC